MLWFGVSRPRAFTWFRQGHVPRVSQEARQQLERTSVHPPRWASMPVLLMNGVQASRSLPVSPCCPPSSQRDSSPCIGLQDQVPNSWLSLLTPQGGCLPVYSSFSSESLPGAQVLTWSLFFPSYPVTHISFLQPWMYRSPFASFQIVFSENYSTCRSIFDVLLRGGEVCVHLLHNLDWSPVSYLLLFDSLIKDLSVLLIFSKSQIFVSLKISMSFLSFKNLYVIHLCSNL